MKKIPKFVIPLALVLCVVIAVIIIVAGGGKENDTNDLNTAVGTIPNVADDVVSTNAVDAANALNEIINLIREEKDVPEFLLEMEKKSGYQIISFEESDDGAVAEVVVYAPDLYTIAKSLDESSTTQGADELYELIKERVMASENDATTLSLEFTKDGDAYVPVISSEFLDALYGGVFRLYDDIISTAE